MNNSPNIMRLVKTDSEAYEWLRDNVYQNGDGEFRIHTNRKGIRLYLSFSNKEFLGKAYHWSSFNENNSWFYHSEAHLIRPIHYSNSMIDANLACCLNGHADNFNGKDFLQDTFDEYMKRNDYYTPKVEFKGTLAEFVVAYNNCQMRQRKNSYSNIDISLFDK